MTAPTRTAGDYSVSRASRDTDRTAVVALWRDHLATPSLMNEKYQWFYCDPPSDSPGLVFLHHGTERKPVGVAGIGARSMFAHGKAISAGVLADFVVEPEHRTLYPAYLLQQRVRDFELPARALLYGEPNEKSLPIVRRLGYVHIGDLIRFAGVLRSSTYMERKVPGVIAAVGGGIFDRVRSLAYRPRGSTLETWRGEWLKSPDARFTDLWQRATEFDGVIGVRDEQFLRWRFGAEPGHKCRIFAISKSSDNGRIAGYAVCEATQQTLSVRDLLVDPEIDEEALRMLVHLLGREAYREGFVSYAFTVLGPQRIYDTLTSAGLVERDRTGIYATFAPAHVGLKHAMWYMTKADFDV